MKILLDIDRIATDPRLQPRIKKDEKLIQEYKERWESFPENVYPFKDPIEVIFDGKFFWMWDGHQRVESAQLAHRRKIEANKEDGTFHTAFVKSCGANANHGKRRNREEEDYQIERMLKNEECREWPDGKIAASCKVTRERVLKMRESLHLVERRQDGQSVPEQKQEVRKVTRGDTTYTMNISNIGENQKKKIDTAPTETSGTDSPTIVILEHDDVSPQPSGYEVMTSSFTFIKSMLMNAKYEFEKLQRRVKDFDNLRGFHGYLTLNNLFTAEIKDALFAIEDAFPTAGICGYCQGEGVCRECGGSRMLTVSQTTQLKKEGRAA